MRAARSPDPTQTTAGAIPHRRPDRTYSTPSWCEPDRRPSARPIRRTGSRASERLVATERRPGPSIARARESGARPPALLSAVADPTVWDERVAGWAYHPEPRCGHALLSGSRPRRHLREVRRNATHAPTFALATIDDGQECLHAAVVDSCRAAVGCIPGPRDSL